MHWVVASDRGVHSDQHCALPLIRGGLHQGDHQNHRDNDDEVDFMLIVCEKIAVAFFGQDEENEAKIVNSTKLQNRLGAG